MCWAEVVQQKMNPPTKQRTDPDHPTNSAVPSSYLQMNNMYALDTYKSEYSKIQQIYVRYCMAGIIS